MNTKLLVTKGIATTSKKLLVAPSLTASNNKATIVVTFFAFFCAQSVGRFALKGDLHPSSCILGFQI